MANITKSDVLTLALLLSLGLNIYEIIKDVCPKYCDNDGRFSDRELAFGGKEVDTNWAINHVQNYRDAHKTDDTYYKTTGFMLSKKVFENIFNETRFNTMCLDLIVDDNENLSILVKGSWTDSTLVDNRLNNGIYINQSMCPTDCSQY